MDQIEEVRRKTDLVQLISESVNLKKAGRNFKGLCPFHEENRRRLWYRKSGRFGSVLAARRAETRLSL